MPSNTRYDWMLKRWAEQNDVMPKDSPTSEPADLTPADPAEQQIKPRQEPEPQVQAQPQGQPGMPAPDDTQQISEMVGVVEPWDRVDIFLDNWEYRVWEGWIGRGAEGDQKAKVLQDVLHQFDNNATMTKGASKSDPTAITYSFKFSLGGNPDGVVDAITAIGKSFLALDNYKVVSGKLYAIVYYADGNQERLDLTSEIRDSKGAPKSVDIDEAVEMALKAVTEAHAPESQWERPKACPECGAKLPNSNDAIAQHYLEKHPDSDIENVYKEEEEAGVPSIQQQVDNLDTALESTVNSLSRRLIDLENPDAFKEEAKACKYCSADLPDENWLICKSCTDKINAGEVPEPQFGPDTKILFKTEAGGMPDLSYRESPMGVSAAQTDNPTEATKWEDEALEKAGKILSEIEDIYGEHEFYVRIRDMLNDVNKIVEDASGASGMSGAPKGEEAKKMKVPEELLFSRNAPPDVPEDQMTDRARSLYQKYKEPTGYEQQPYGPKNEVNKQRVTTQAQ